MQEDKEISDCTLCIEKPVTQNMMSVLEDSLLSQSICLEVRCSNMIYFKQYKSNSETVTI